MKFILYQGTNDRLWLNEQGQPIFCVDDRGIEFDFRTNAPFKQLLPCQKCGVEQDRNHHLTKHIQWGTPLIPLSILDTLSEETYSYEV